MQWTVECTITNVRSRREAFLTQDFFITFMAKSSRSMNIHVAMGKELFSMFHRPFLITDSPSDENISIILNGIESELKFITDSKGDKVWH